MGLPFLKGSDSKYFGLCGDKSQGWSLQTRRARSKTRKAAKIGENL
jgi:hypothetical protein